jgi:hypothetical protein
MPEKTLPAIQTIDQRLSINPYVDGDPRLTIEHGYAQLFVRTDSTHSELMCEANATVGSLLDSLLVDLSHVGYENPDVARQISIINKINTQLRGRRPFERIEPTALPPPAQGRSILSRRLGNLTFRPYESLNDPEPGQRNGEAVIRGHKARLVLHNLRVAGAILTHEATTFPGHHIESLTRIAKANDMTTLRNKLIGPFVGTRYEIT